MAIALPDADLDAVAMLIVTGNLAYTGQQMFCTGLKLMMAHSSVVNALIVRVVAGIMALNVFFFFRKDPEGKNAKGKNF